MGGFPLIGSRPVRSRVLVLYRVDPSIAAGLLPAGVRPRLHHGQAIGLMCFTRLGSLRGRFLPSKDAVSDHLDYRFAVEREGAGKSWVLHRETSSWLGGRLGERIIRGKYVRSRFEIQEGTFEFELRVESEHGEELYLRAEACGTSPAKLVPTPHDLERYLTACGSAEPHDVLAPEADRIDAQDGFAPQPLSIFELRSRFFENRELFPPGTATVDGAWKLANQRLERAPERAPAVPAL